MRHEKNNKVKQVPPVDDDKNGMLRRGIKSKKEMD